MLVPLCTLQLLLTTHLLKEVLLFVAMKVVTAVLRQMVLSSGKEVHAAVEEVIPSAQRVTVMTAGTLICARVDAHLAQLRCAANALKLNAKTMEVVTAEAMVLVL